MARGSARAPSHNAYRGTLGRTQTASVHVTGPRGDLLVATVHTTIDAVSDPDLVARLHADDPARALNTIKLDGGDTLHVATPLVYHDPAAELLVLVLGEAHRHRELDERIRLLERLRGDDTPIPAYAKDFAVVFGPAGLRAYLERRAHEAVAMVEVNRDAERRRAELAARDAEVERLRGEAERRTRELEAARAETTARTDELGRAQVELERVRVEAKMLAAAAKSTPVAATAAKSTPVPATAAAVAASTVAALPNADELATHRLTLADPEPDTGVKHPPAPTAAPVAAAPAARAGSNGHDKRKGGQLAAAVAAASKVAPTPVAAAPAPAPAPIGAPTTSDRTTQLTDDEMIDPAEVPALGVAAQPVASPAPARPSSSELPTAIATPAANGHAAAAAAAAAATTDAPATADPEDGSIDIVADSGLHEADSIIPVGADPLTTETNELAEGDIDPWLEHALASPSSKLAVGDGGVRLAIVANEQLARSLNGQLDVRLLLHRTPSYPLVTLVLGPPAALRVPSPSQLAIVPLDIGADLDRHVLGALGKHFEIAVDVITHGTRIRRVQLLAPLAENVGYIVRAADDHLRGVIAEGAEPSFARAKELVLDRDYDVLGAEHAEAAEFRDDKLAQLESAQSLRRAIAMARRFARPSREDYLVCTRGFPLPRWRELRRHVLESAVTWGLWMGPELAQVAVSEGLARSRRDLIVRLDAGFEQLRRHPEAFDIDDDAADDNLKAITEEARALGVELRRRPKTGPIASDEDDQVAGSIEQPPAPAETGGGRSVEELIALLDDRRARVTAAVELCERADGRAAAPVIAAVKKMSRAEAVRVLGMSVRFGAAAAPPLVEGLASSKAFLRHGCALALALLRTEDGTLAVIDLLLNEPTEIWREVARAIGQIGPPALMPLASSYGRLGDLATPAAQERVAWAMAHIGVRGGKAAIETMAAGSSVVAPVARKAIDLLGSAARDQVRMSPGAEGSQPGRDVTVNRAFSRRFFEALEQGTPEAGAQGLEDLDASAPMEMLDESELIEAEDGEGAGARGDDETSDHPDEDEAELDESDLIQT